MWLILTTSLLLSAPPDVEVTTLAGARSTGALVSLSAEQVVVRSASGEERLAAADLLSLKLLKAEAAKDVPEPTIWIELIDDSRLLATRYTVASGIARVVLVGGESVEIPTRSIRAVRMQTHDSELARQSKLAQQWREILAGTPAGDIIVVRKLTPKDDDEQQMSAALDQLEGVLGEVSDEKVLFTYDEQQIPVDRAKVEGVIYFHPSGRELPDPLCRVDDAFGSQWNVKSLALEGETLQLVSATGVKGQLPIGSLKQLDYSAGKIVYLSDLEPETSQWTNYFGDTAGSKGLERLYAPRRDRSFSGAKITVGGKQFEKGLAIHSRTRLEYRLSGKFSKFLALAAIDHEAGGAGDVKLIVSLDGKPLAEHHITGGDEEPLAIEHDIRGGKKLTILVDYGAGLDVSDRLHLASARVTK